MLKILLLTLFISGQVFAEDNSIIYVAKYAMVTAKSKNFKELAENLFTEGPTRQEVLKFLKKHELLKRSLPDVIAEPSSLIVKERTKNSSLDFSKIESKKFILNKKEIPFKGNESFTQVYLLFLNKKQTHTPVIASVALAFYAKASLIDISDQ